MAKKKKKKNRKPLEHPTIFVFDGGLQNYEDGSMLNLHMQITAEEWQIIVTETVQYKIFLDCLKETAFPILKEVWGKEEEWWRFQLEIAIGRMKNIDPMIFISYGLNQENIKKAYTEKMQRNAAEVVDQIKALRSQAFSAIDPTRTDLSDL